MASKFHHAHSSTRYKHATALRRSPRARTVLHILGIAALSRAARLRRSSSMANRLQVLSRHFDDGIDASSGELLSCRGGAQGLRNTPARAWPPPSIRPPFVLLLLWREGGTGDLAMSLLLIPRWQPHSKGAGPLFSPLPGTHMGSLTRCCVLSRSPQTTGSQTAGLARCNTKGVQVRSRTHRSWPGS